MSDIDAILAEREKTHGDYTDHATVTQELKQILKITLDKTGVVLSNDQAETLGMIMHKIGRTVSSVSA